MSADEQDLSVNQRMDLAISEANSDFQMGSNPVGSLSIEYDEIRNELQRKMVEEITCISC